MAPRQLINSVALGSRNRPVYDNRGPFCRWGLVHFAELQGKAALASVTIEDCMQYSAGTLTLASRLSPINMVGGLEANALNGGACSINWRIATIRPPQTASRANNGRPAQAAVEVSSYVEHRYDELLQHLDQLDERARHIQQPTQSDQ